MLQTLSVRSTEAGDERGYSYYTCSLLCLATAEIEDALRLWILTGNSECGAKSVAGFKSHRNGYTIPDLSHCPFSGF